MPDKETPRALSVLDKCLIAGLVGCLVWPAIPQLLGLSPRAQTLMNAPYSISLCALMVVWMLKGGAKSPLWKWMPPFMPWGWVLKSDAGRWALVIVFAGVVTASAVYLVVRAAQVAL